MIARLGEEAMEESESFEPTHADRVTVVHTNDDGSKLLTASLDHKVKVWTVDRESGNQTLLDTFTAHDAQVVDAKFTSRTVGSYIGTIGADLCFKVWKEDVSQAPNSGRRFRPIAMIPSTSRVPFASFDFKTLDFVYLHLALIDRQGLLSVYEPSDPDNLKEWTLLDQFSVCSPTPSRGVETSFKVSFDPNNTPLPYIESLSDDTKQLALLVSSLDEVKIYHSVTTDPQNGDDTSSTSPNGANNRITFHELLKLPTHPALVRDIAWSTSNVRGVETIATSCRDGTIHVFELSLHPKSGDISTSTQTPNPASATLTPPQRPDRNPIHPRPSQQSSLTTAITGRTSSSTNPHTATTVPNNSSKSSRQPKPHVFPYAYRIAHTSKFSAHGDAWYVDWDPQGNLLMSGGNDGVARLWSKDVLGGEWIAFGELAVDSEGEGGGGDVEVRESA